MKHEATTRLMYGSAAALLAALWLGVLWHPVHAALPENDLWWMLPTMAHYTEGVPWLRLLAFLFSPAPLLLGQPVLKIYLWLGQAFFHGAMTPLVLIAVAMHLANAVLLYVLSRQLALGRRVSLCAALIYLTFFAHFHAYLWPTAFQHLVAVTTILGLVTAYAHAERLGAGHRAARGWYVAVLGLTLMASLQRSTLIAPALILTHILCCSTSTNDRAARYARWTPLFALYAVYPVLALTCVGDPIISTALAQGWWGPGVTTAALLLGIAAGLWAVRWFVRAPAHDRRRWWLTRVVLPAAGLAVFVLLCLRDHRQLLLPYNALLPLGSTLASFLDPLHTALAFDAVEPYYLLPVQTGVMYLLLAVALPALFLAEALPRAPQRLLLVVWYALCLLRLNVGSYLIRIPSRYFIYLSPVAAILLSWAMISIVEGLSARARLRQPLRDLVTAGFVVLLCAPNVLAIRVALFRGRLANTYDLYDDVRAAHLMQGDLRKEASMRIRPETIAVQQVLPPPMQEIAPSAPHRPEAHDTFRAVMVSVFGDPAMRSVRVNDAPASVEAHAVYVISVARVHTAAGEDIDPFTRLMDSALDRLIAGHEAEALALFRQAIAARPFLLRYLLAPCDLDDARWVTGGADLRGWTDALGALRAGWVERPVPKYERIAATMRQELSDYLLCLVCAAYLEEQAGHAARSRYWLAQTRLIESDPQHWPAWTGVNTVLAANASLSAFIHRAQAPGAIGDPTPWRADEYGLPRFLLRLIVRWDVRGRHERLAVMPPRETVPAQRAPVLPAAPAGV